MEYLSEGQRGRFGTAKKRRFNPYFNGIPFGRREAWRIAKNLSGFQSLF